MFSEFIDLLSGWILLDTWIVITGALAAMACALPGAWLLLRKQSLLGDALSHSILPGIVLSYLALASIERVGWLSPESGLRHPVIFLGAALSGVLSAILTELLERWGRLDRSAAIGVVFTSMFALGLLLIPMFADKADLDPGCVLYGSLETSVSTGISARNPVPQAVFVNGAMLLVNGLLVILFFRQLRLSTFDPGFAGTIGVKANWIQLALMVVTAATLVSAFESVGAILVIAMLIIPPATARLLTDRLSTMLVICLVVAALSAGLGHVFALTLPVIVFSRLGYPDVHDSSTTGMMAVASGCLFIAAILFSPRHGVFRKIYDRLRLRYRIAAEDLLASLYRREEMSAVGSAGPSLSVARTNWLDRLVEWRLGSKGLLTTQNQVTQLTDRGRESARNLVRSHRLWEAYMAKHFHLPEDHLHATAEQVEHYLSPEMQSELAAELQQPETDPHGKSIP